MSTNNINSENRLTAGAQTYKDIVTVMTKDADWLYKAGLVIRQERRRTIYNSETTKEIVNALYKLNEDEDYRKAIFYINLVGHISDYLCHTDFALENGLGVDILKNIIDTIDLGIRMRDFKEKVIEENWTIKDANKGMKEFWIEYNILQQELEALTHIKGNNKMIVSFQSIKIGGGYLN